jgi:uncharacterized membrane protein
MNTQQSQQQTLWQQLKDRKLVSGEFKTPDELDSPWFIKLLLAFSGWFASLFIFGFFLLIIYDAIENSGVCLLIGSGLIALAYKILKSKPPEFLEHLMLSFSLAGQALLAWAIFMAANMDSALSPWLAIFVIQSSLCIIMPHYIHRVSSAFFASIALAFCLYYLNLSALTSASLLLLVIFLVLNEWRSVKWQSTFEAISYGVILLLIPLKGSAVIGYEFSYWFDGAIQQSWYYYLDELLLLFSMLYLIIALMLRSQHHFPLGTKVAIILATMGLCLLSMQASGITIGFALLILGFSNSNKILQALGLTSLLFYISSYYYLLTLTLLEKAGILLIMGLFILAIRYILLKWFNPSSMQFNSTQLPTIEKGEHHAV